MRNFLLFIFFPYISRFCKALYLDLIKFQNEEEFFRIFTFVFNLILSRKGDFFAICSYIHLMGKISIENSTV